MVRVLCKTIGGTSSRTVRSVSDEKSVGGFDSCRRLLECPWKLGTT